MAAKKPAKKGTKKSPQKARSEKPKTPPPLTAFQGMLLDLINEVIEDFVILDESEDLHNLRHLLRPKADGRAPVLTVGTIVRVSELDKIIERFVRERSKDLESLVTDSNEAHEANELLDRAAKLGQTVKQKFGRNT
jgi:hypothetical protein